MVYPLWNQRIKIRCQEPTKPPQTQHKLCSSYSLVGNLDILSLDTSMGHIGLVWMLACAALACRLRPSIGASFLSPRRHSSRITSSVGTFLMTEPSSKKARTEGGADPTSATSNPDTEVASQSPKKKQKQQQHNRPQQQGSMDVPLYHSEGLFAVEKPLEWTSNDVVSYIRGMLEREARGRGAYVTPVRSRKNKSRKVKVGHGGTLDPLATGVLVIGVGKGTKELQTFLTGSKRYSATVELGFETNTLDREGTVTSKKSFDHVTIEKIKVVLPEFTGKIQQVPPIFSALRKNGKRLHESAREGATAEDLEIEAREVEVYQLNLIDPDSIQIPKFDIDVECGGGTYIRSLVRDIGRKLDTVATMTRLKRTKQGQFVPEDCLKKEDWSAEKIYEAITSMNSQRAVGSENEAS